MTMVNALGRVGEIQARLVQLNDLVAGKPPTPAVTAAAEASATSFATAFGAATAANGAPATRAAESVAPPAAVPGTAVPGTGGVTGSAVVAAAEKYLGVPYVFGGEDSSGMDCSGLVQRVYADLGVEVPRLVSGQMTIGSEVASLADAEPGDLIVTGGGDHILIYAGDNQVIHAPYEGRTVSKVDAYMSESDIHTIRRVIPDAPAAAVASSPVAVDSSPAAVPSAALAGTNPTDLVSAAYASLFNNGSAGSASLASLSPMSAAASPYAALSAALSGSGLAS